MPIDDVLCVCVCICVCAHNGQLLSAFMASNCQVPRVCSRTASKSKVNVVDAAALVVVLVAVV